MPTISEFFGIRIEIRFLDHNPPHFHAKYQKDKVSIEIKDGKVKGEMSERLYASRPNGSNVINGAGMARPAPRRTAGGMATSLHGY